jgi:hypothetical protein
VNLSPCFFSPALVQRTPGSCFVAPFEGLHGSVHIVYPAASSDSSAIINRLQKTHRTPYDMPLEIPFQQPLTMLYKILVSS